MFTWCRKRKADIIFLQETHSTMKTDTQWKNEWGADIITSHGSPNARGVSILIKNGFDCTIHQKILDPLGRFIILKADIKDKTMFMQQTKTKISYRFSITYSRRYKKKTNLDSEDNIIIGGDFNCPLSQRLIKKEA